jgi:Domain of unknown function (DUF1905)
MRYVFDAELWQWAARVDSWIFVSVPTEYFDEIQDAAAGPPRGFGSVRVTVRIGSSRWKTSIFPDGGSRTYVLPLKKAVRTAEGIDVGDAVTVDVELEL